MVQQCQPGFRFDENLGRCVRIRTTSAAAGVRSRQRIAKRKRGQLGGTQVQKETPAQRKSRQQSETSTRSANIQFSGQNRQPDTFQDIASQTVESEQRRLSDTSGRFKNLPQTTSFDFGGRIFSIDADGQITDIRRGRTRQGSTEVIGINDQGTRTRIGESTTSKVVIDPTTGEGTIQTTAGRVPIGLFQRGSGGQGLGTIAPGQEQLAASAQVGGRDASTITNVSDLQISGADKAAKLRTAGLLGGPLTTHGATKRLSEIGDIDFAKQLGIFTTNPPKPSKGEDSRDFRVRLAEWKTSNITKAFNESMKNWEQQQVQNSLKRQQELFEKPGLEFKSKSQIENELRNNNDLNTAFNAATTQLTSSRKAQTEANIKKRTARLGTGSEKSRELATKAIEEEERKKEKEDIASGLADLETQKEDRITSLTEQQINAEGSLQAEIKRKAGLSLAERAAEEKSDFIEAKTESLVEADPSLTLNAAIAKAKKIFKGDEGKPPSIREISSDLDDVILEQGFDQNNAFSIAASRFGNNTSAAEKYLKSRGFPESQIKEQKRDYQENVLKIKPEFLNEEDEVMAIKNRIDSVISGSGDGFSVMDILNDLDSDFMKQQFLQNVANSEKSTNDAKDVSNFELDKLNRKIKKEKKQNIVKNVTSGGTPAAGAPKLPNEDFNSDLTSEKVKLLTTQIKRRLPSLKLAADKDAREAAREQVNQVLATDGPQAALDLIADIGIANSEAQTREDLSKQDEAIGIGGQLLTIMKDTELSFGINVTRARLFGEFLGIQPSGERRKIEQWIGLLNAPIRNKLFGASLTEGEKTAANTFLIDEEKDTADVIKEKTKGLIAASKFSQYIKGLQLAGFSQRTLRNLDIPRKTLNDFLADEGYEIPVEATIQNDIIRKPERVDIESIKTQVQGGQEIDTGNKFFDNTVNNFDLWLQQPKDFRDKTVQKIINEGFDPAILRLIFR